MSGCVSFASTRSVSTSLCLSVSVSPFLSLGIWLSLCLGFFSLSFFSLLVSPCICISSIGSCCLLSLPICLSLCLSLSLAVAAWTRHLCCSEVSSLSVIKGDNMCLLVSPFVSSGVTELYILVRDDVGGHAVRAAAERHQQRQQQQQRRCSSSSKQQPLRIHCMILSAAVRTVGDALRDFDSRVDVRTSEGCLLSPHMSLFVSLSVYLSLFHSLSFLLCSCLFSLSPLLLCLFAAVSCLFVCLFATSKRSAPHLYLSLSLSVSSCSICSNVCLYPSGWRVSQCDSSA